MGHDTIKNFSEKAKAVNQRWEKAKGKHPMAYDTGKTLAGIALNISVAGTLPAMEDADSFLARSFTGATTALNTVGLIGNVLNLAHDLDNAILSKAEDAPVAEIPYAEPVETTETADEAMQKSFAHPVDIIVDSEDEPTVAEEPVTEEESTESETVSAHGLNFIDVMNQPEEYEQMKQAEARGEVQLVTRYRRSFRANLMESKDFVKEYYSAVKNRLLSYKGVNDRMSWSSESYNKGRTPVCRLVVHPSHLYAYLNIDPKSLENTKYNVTDLSERKKFEKTPTLVKVSGERKFRHLLELIDKICAETLECKLLEDREPINYVEKPKDLEEMVTEGIVRKLVATAPVNAVVETTVNLPD